MSSPSRTKSRARVVETDELTVSFGLVPILVAMFGKRGRVGPGHGGHMSCEAAAMTDCETGVDGEGEIVGIASSSIGVRTSGEARFSGGLWGRNHKSTVATKQ